MDTSHARFLLEQFSEKPSGTCSAQRTLVDPKYDLEIIVPVYNTEQFLEECLNSIFSQKTKFNYHVIAVNDGSTDSSPEILKRYDSPLLTVVDQKNGGTAKARNAGIDASSGKYIMFVDSDDVLPENTVEVLLDRAFANDSDIVEGSADYFSDGVFNRYYLHQDSDRTDFKAVNACIWGKVFSAKLFASFSFPDGFWYEDTADAFVLFPMAQKVSTCSDVVYNYRINKNGMTAVTKKKPKALDTFWITEECVKEYVNRGYILDEYFVFYFTKQLIVNCQRLLGYPRDVQKAVFILSGSIIKQLNLEESDNRLLKIIRKEYYNRYRLYCLLH